MIAVMQARREFLKGVAGAMALQVGPPKQAKITSSVMLWTLKGTFEERVAAAAEAGIQAVELVSEQQASVRCGCGEVQAAGGKLPNANGHGGGPDRIGPSGR